jgi:hypothetical protein
VDDEPSVAQRQKLALKRRSFLASRRADPGLQRSRGAAGSLLAAGAALQPSETRRRLLTQISGVEFDFTGKELHRLQQVNPRLIALAPQTQIEGFDRTRKPQDAAIFNVDRIREVIPIEGLAVAVRPSIVVFQP